jgi:hypothetical protein
MTSPALSWVIAGTAGVRTGRMAGNTVERSHLALGGTGRQVRPP